MRKTVLLPFLAHIELGSIEISQGKVLSRTPKSLMIHSSVQFFLNSNKVSRKQNWSSSRIIFKPFSVSQGFCVFLTRHVFLISETEDLLVIPWITLGMLSQTCIEFKAKLTCVWHIRTIPHIHVMTQRQPWRAKMQLGTWSVKDKG